MNQRKKESSVEDGTYRSTELGGTLALLFFLSLIQLVERVLGACSRRCC